MSTAYESPEMFRPPVNRAMRILDRPLFNKTIQTSVARIIDRKQISKCRKELHHDILKLDRMSAVRAVQDPHGGEAKALLLKPEVKPDGKLNIDGDRRPRNSSRIDVSTWSPSLSDLVKSSQVALMRYDLAMDYDYWNYRMYVRNYSLLVRLDTNAPKMTS